MATKQVVIGASLREILRRRAVESQGSPAWQKKLLALHGRSAAWRLVAQREPCCLGTLDRGTPETLHRLSRGGSPNPERGRNTPPPVPIRDAGRDGYCRSSSLSQSRAGAPPAGSPN